MTICHSLRVNWKQQMLNTSLILALILITTVAFASNGFVQHDKNTSVIICVEQRLNKSYFSV